MTNRRIFLPGGWEIHLSVDDDNHLGVYVSNKDETEVIPTDSDIGGPNEWAERFTTKGIEDDYIHSS